MATYRSCSWCHASNDVTAAVTTGQMVICGECGHRADVCRLDCDCPACNHMRAGFPSHHPAGCSCGSPDCPEWQAMMNPVE